MRSVRRAGLVAFLGGLAALVSVAAEGGLPDVWELRVAAIAVAFAGALANPGAEW